MSYRNLRSTFLCTAICLFAAAGSVHSQATKLGTVEFPTSGAGKAQEHFLRGVAAMHSFWYEEALEEFRAATKADPSFAMAYWGEAMAHNHPIWQEQDTAAGRAALAKIGDASKLSDRERAFIEAARILYGQGEKPARDRAYLAAMEKVYSQYPDDLEAASFYSLALLGVHGYKVEGHPERMRAGSIALQVYAKNPNHPGAAHYIIHSFDDPEHAILALPAAYRYAEIAPAAHHAKHMPSHIFIQLGMWPEAAASNEAAWQTSADWVARKKLHPSLRDFHSLHWLHYIYLQQGRWARAEGLLDLRRIAANETASVGDAYRGRSDRLWSDMAAQAVLETENWKRAFELFPDAAPSASSAADAGAHHHGGIPATGGRDQVTRNQVLAAYVRGMAAAHMGQPEADAARARLESMAEQARKRGDEELSESLLVMSGEVAAVHALKREETRKAIAAMEQAVKREEAMPAPSGPPDLIKPSHEVFGEILLAAGDAQRAREQFAWSLERHPNRARSLVGAARAAAAAGDAAAASDYYGKLLDVWRYADTQMAELKEAREYLQKNARTVGKDCAFCK
jgi:tetratricopeptide (TPR) repeat protein